MATPWKHPESGSYYLRERVPAAVSKQAKGRTLALRIDGQPYQVKVGGWVKLSLRTKDANTAKERYRDASAALQEYYRLIQQETENGPVRLTQRQTEALAGEYWRDQTQQHQDNPGDPDAWDAARTALEDMGDSMEGLERLHGEDADRLLQRRGLSVDAASREELLRLMHRAYAMFAQGQERRGLGDYSPDKRAERFPVYPDEEARTTASMAKHSEDKPKVSLDDIFDRWVEKHRLKNRSERTIGNYRQKLNSLHQFLGHDDAEAVTPRDMAEWQRHLQVTEKLSPRTVSDSYLAAISSMFRRAKGSFLLAHNPVADLERDRPDKIINRERGFTDAEAKAILTAALRDPSTLGGMAEKNKQAIRWTPWIGAYTGARITELTQLRREDFITEAGMPCIKITPEAGSVKNGQYRVVPLHPHLIEMGLPEWVQGQPEGYLFTTAAETLEHTAKRCRGVSGKVSKWVRKVAGVTDPEVQPTHGWRHRFKTLATEVDIAPEYADMIQGHKRGDAAAIYRGARMVAFYREIQKLPRYDWT